MDPVRETLSETALHEALSAVLTGPAHAVTMIATTRVTPTALLQVGPARQRQLRLTEGLGSRNARIVFRELDDDGRLGLRDAPDELLDGLCQHTRGNPKSHSTSARSRDPSSADSAARISIAALALLRSGQHPVDRGLAGPHPGSSQPVSHRGQRPADGPERALVPRVLAGQQAPLGVVADERHPVRGRRRMPVLLLTLAPPVQHRLLRGHQGAAASRSAPRSGACRAHRSPPEAVGPTARAGDGTRRAPGSRGPRPAGGRSKPARSDARGTGPRWRSAWSAAPEPRPGPPPPRAPPRPACTGPGRSARSAGSAAPGWRWRAVGRPNEACHCAIHWAWIAVLGHSTTVGRPSRRAASSPISVLPPPGGTTR